MVYIFLSFVSIFVSSFVCAFVCNSVTTTKFLVKVSPMVYVSVAPDQKAFIF